MNVWIRMDRKNDCDVLPVKNRQQSFDNFEDPRPKIFAPMASDQNDSTVPVLGSYAIPARG